MAKVAIHEGDDEALTARALAIARRHGLRTGSFVLVEQTANYGSSYQAAVTVPDAAGRPLFRHAVAAPVYEEQEPAVFGPPVRVAVALPLDCPWLEIPATERFPARSADRDEDEPPPALQIDAEGVYYELPGPLVKAAVTRKRSHAELAGQADEMLGWYLDKLRLAGLALTPNAEEK
jgi:hypothetical protein